MNSTPSPILNESLSRHNTWFGEARFGLFIHWGIYAVHAGVWKGIPQSIYTEWVKWGAKIPDEEYFPLATQFDPQDFDADAIVSLAKRVGMKYVVFTAKHHDGFAMFDSFHPFSILKATPFGRDPAQELAEACARHGLTLCFYYSHDIDFTAPGGSRHWEEDDAAGRDYSVSDEHFAQYLENKVKPQLRELLTQYGPVGLLWFDTPAKITREQALDIRQFVKSLQPDCLINGRLGFDAGDYGSLGDNQIPEGPVAGLWEVPATMNNSWAYKATDENWKSFDYLLRLLVQCASKGVNYLLNVGPKADGFLPQVSLEILQKFEGWMDIHRSSIHGTDPSPFATDFSWGRCTTRGHHLYIHIFDVERGEYELPGLQNHIVKATLLCDRDAEVKIIPSDAKYSPRLKLASFSPTFPVTVIDVELDGPVTIDQTPRESINGEIHLPLNLAELRGFEADAVDIAGYLRKWDDVASRLSWKIQVHTPGVFSIRVCSFLDRVSGSIHGVVGDQEKRLFGNHRLRLTVGAKSIEGVAGVKDLVMDEAVNRWHRAEADFGTIRIDEAGSCLVVLEMIERALDSRLGPTICAVLLKRESESR